MIVKRAFIWLFPLYLLAVQHAGLAHALTHTSKPSSGKDALAQLDLCTKCTSFAKMSTAATTSPYHGPKLPDATERVVETALHFVAAPRLAPRSRSPPALR